MAFPTVTVTPGSGQTVNTLPNAGQNTMANSLGVVIASDQSAIPVSGTVTANVNGGNAVAVKVDGSAVTQPVSGTFWQATQPVSGSVTATISGNPVLGAGANAIGSITNTTFGISGTLPAFASTPTFNIGTAPNLTITNTGFANTSFVAQGSATSGQTGALIVGAVTTAAPTYTTGNTNPLSLTTAGALRGDLSSISGTAISPTTAQLGVALVKINGFSAAGAGANGSPVASLGVTISTAVNQVDQNSTAFAGSGSVVGTIVASSQGGGAAISAEINVTALTLGTATAVFAILQESRGGTNFTDIWVSDPITATGIVSMPAVPVAGRRRWRFFSVGGTSTTVTATITSLELPAGYIVQRQMRDYYAATNPFAAMSNSVALTASNFVLGTVSTATTPMYIEGCKSITAFMTLSGAPTVTTQPTVTLQLSMDGTNWWSTASTLVAAGNGTYMSNYQGTAKFARLLVTTAAAYSAGAYTISNIGIQGVN